jgi:serine/threonine protein phosphatase PrpC
MNTLKYYHILYNETHGDDQINIFQVGNYHVFMVADGVSDCEIGRMASVIACSIFEEYIKEKIGKQEKLNLEETILEGFHRIGEKLMSIKTSICDPLNEHAIEDVINSIKLFIYEKKWLEETPRDLIEEKIKEIRERLITFRNQGKSFSSDTVLGVAIITNHKVYTAALGDVEMYIFRKNKLLPHYVLPKGGFIEDYLNTNKGIVGTIDFAMRRLEKGDIFILCSDGANLSYAPYGGYPYALFVNQLIKSLEKGENIALEWFKRLSKEYDGKLPDD